jgi:DNA-binding transcriptional MerR regulator
MTQSDHPKPSLDRQLELTDIPNIDLYMDQVIQLFERTFEETTRTEGETILTKTMINNYAKKKLFFPVTNKKYTKNHLILISLIYQLKGTFSINDIKTILTDLNTGVTEQTIDLEDFYQTYLDATAVNQTIFEEQQPPTDDLDHLEQLQLILSLAHMSNLYRRAAERLIDRLEK